MCSKYNRLLLSTCALAFGIFASFPANAEFKWTPPDDTEHVEDMGPDVFMMENEDAPGLTPGSALPEYYDAPVIEERTIIEVEPLIEIKEVEESDSVNEPVEIRTITLDYKDEPAAADPLPTPVKTEPMEEKSAQAEPAEEARSVPATSLVLNPYPLEGKDSLPIEEEEAVEEQPPVQIEATEEGAKHDIIEGFGKDMPIALALGQIVPPEYAYSFGDNVNPGARISWEGGKSWDEVLNDALAPLDMEASIHDKKIVIKNNNVQAFMPKMSDVAPATRQIDSKPDPQAEFAKTPEESMGALLEKKIIRDNSVSSTAQHESVVLDKNNIENDNYGNEDNSALVENLMRPLDSYEENEIAVTYSDIDEAERTEFKPEIILNEQERAEEEYAKKLGESSPFDDTEEAMEILPIEDVPDISDTKDASDLPYPLPLDEEEMNLTDMEIEEVNASDVEDSAALPSNEEIEASLMEEPPSSYSSFRETPSNKIRIWEAKRNSNLQKILEEWSAKEGVLLIWDTTEKYVLDYDVFISGTFQNAIDILFKKGLKKAPEYTLSGSPYRISIQGEEVRG